MGADIHAFAFALAPAQTLCSALMAGGFFLFRQEKVTKKKATPGSAVGCADFPAVLDLVAPLLNSLRELAFATLRQSQRVRARSALRARATSSALLGASQAHRGLPQHRLRGSAVGLSSGSTAAASRRAAPGRGDLCGDEERSTGVGVRTRTLRHLTCRVCPSAARSA